MFNNKTLKLKMFANKSMALMLTLIIVVSAFSGILIFNNDIKTQAATVFDSQNPTSYTELVNEDFTDGSFNESDWNVAYKSAHLTENTGLKLDNPTLTYTGNSSYLSNFMAVSQTKNSVNQHISTEYTVSANPTSWNNDRFNYLWARVNTGNGYNGINRGLHNASVTGYYVKFSTISNDPIVLFRKSSTENGTSLMRISGYTNPINTLPGVYRIDMTVTGTSPTVINVRVYKRSGDSVDNYTWSVIASNTYVDESGLQNTSGSVALSMDPNGNATTYIKNFRYLTTDVAEGATETFNYVEKTNVDTSGRLFAQVVTLDPSKTYQLTSYTANTDTTVMERFWVEYYSQSGSNQSGNKQRVTIDVPTVSLDLGYYTASTSTFCLNEHVSEKSASPAESNDTVQWSGMGNRTRAIVGFRIDTSQNKKAVLSNFELYEIDPETGARKGGNLIVNGDFKLGLYAWNDNQEKVYTNYTSSEVGDSVSEKGLVTCYTCANAEEFNNMFGKVETEEEPEEGSNNTYTTDFSTGNTDGWLLSSNSAISIGSLNITGSNATNSHIDNTAFYMTNKIEQRVTVEFEVNANNKHKKAIVWARASFDDQNDPTTLTGYYAVYKNNGTVKLYKRYKDGNTYKNEFIGNCGFVHSDNRLYRFEIVVEGTNATKISVLTYKYSTDKKTCYYLYKNTYYDDTADLQDAGMAGVAAAIDGDTSDNTMNFTKFEYSSTDGESKKLAYLQKVNGVNSYITFGQILALDPNKTYVFEGITTESNLGLWVQYNTNSASNGCERIFANGGTTSTADNWRRISCEFNLNEWATSNSKTAPYVDENFSVGETGQVLTLVGFRMAKITEMGYAEFTVYEKDDPDKKNLLVNSDFKMGLYGWYDEPNTSFLAFKATFEDDTSSPNSRVNLVFPNQDTYKSLFAVGDVEVDDEYDDSDDDDDQGGNDDDDQGGGGTVSTRPVLDNVDENLNYTISSDFANGYSGKWKTNSAVTAASDSMTVNGTSKLYESLSLYGEAHTDQVVALDFAQTNGVSPVIWARAVLSDENDLSTVSGYYVFRNGATTTLYKRTSDGREVLIGECGTHTDTRTFRMEIAVEGTAPTKITVSTYKYSSGQTSGNCFMMLKNTFFDYTEELQTPGYAGFSTRNTTPVTVTRFDYASSDGTIDNYSYIEKPESTNTSALAGQQITVDPNKTYTLSARVSQANARLSLKYWSASGSMVTVSSSTGSMSEVNGYRTVSYTFCINDWATANGQPLAKTGDGYGDLAQIFVGFTTEGANPYYYTELKLCEEGSNLNLITNADFKMGLYGWSDAISTGKWAFQTANYGTTKSTLERLELKTNVAKTKYDMIFKASSSDGDDIDYSKVNKFMLRLTGDAGYEFGKVGQIVELEVGKTYVYSVDFGFDPRNEAKPIAFYHTVPDEEISPAADKRKEFNWLMTKSGSRYTYTFTVPDEAYVNPETGKATVFVGFTTGKKENNCYFYNFDLYEKNDSKKTNLFVNPDFKQGFYGWMINSNYFWNSMKSDIVAATGEYVRPGGDLELLPYDSSKFKLDDGTLTVPDVPDGVDYSSYNGKYMLHIPKTVTATYGKVGQIVYLNTKTEYEFTMRFKYIRQNSVKPTILYYTDNPFITEAEMKAKGYKDKQAYFTAIRKVATFEETMDDPNCRITLTFKVPSDAWLDSSGKSPVFVGISTGEYEPICYFADICLRKAGTTKNLLTNPDFKDGFYGWVAVYGYDLTTPVSEKGIYWTNGYTIAQLLPLDDSIFVNDTTDALWDDGDWFLRFGDDDKILNGELSSEGTGTDTVKKVVVKGEVNILMTALLYGGIAIVSAGLIFFIIILIKKKRNRANN